MEKLVEGTDEFFTFAMKQFELALRDMVKTNSKAYAFRFRESENGRERDAWMLFTVTTREQLDKLESLGIVRQVPFADLPENRAYGWGNAQSPDGPMIR
jgi:hypothetical protein